MKATNNTITERVRAELFSMKDEKYADFVASLIPTIERERIIGVRTPALRKYAKEMTDADAEAFIRALPHEYYEENNLHAFLIERTRDFDTAIARLGDFLPCVDNWATCDSMRPKIFKKHTGRLYKQVLKWLGSEHTYTVRYAIGMLHSYFLDEAFLLSHLELVAAVESDEYYINMMAAWYFATALAKQREAALPYFCEKRLREPVLSMAYRKCLDSYRISDEDKMTLRALCNK